jgi:hypothetical protein
MLHMRLYNEWYIVKCWIMVYVNVTYENGKYDAT